jgi:hypothetical protein
MNSSIINFIDAKNSYYSQKDREKSVLAKKNTEDFAFKLNSLVCEFNIDPVHQATLLMAKSIDVLVTAGPVPANLDEQHARAKNLLQSIIRSRSELIEKSVRIVTSEDINLKKTGEDLAF